MSSNPAAIVRPLALLCILAGTVLPSAAADEPLGSLRVGEQTLLDGEAWKWNWASWDQEKILTFDRFQYTVYWDADRVFVLARVPGQAAGEAAPRRHRAGGADVGRSQAGGPGHLSPVLERTPRWCQERILSFTAKAGPSGFAIVDAKIVGF